MYNKARDVIEPFAFEKYRKEKIRQQIEATRPSRLQIKSNLPAINQDLALKLMDAQSNKKSTTANLLQDNRFAAMFENPDFQVDKNADEYRLLAPVLTRLDKSKLKELKRKATSTAVFTQADQEERHSSDDDLFSEADDDNEDDDEKNASSEDDDLAWTKDMKKQYRQIQKDKRKRRDVDEEDEDEAAVTAQVEQPTKSVTMKEYDVKSIRSKVNKYDFDCVPVGERYFQYNICYFLFLFICTEQVSAREWLPMRTLVRQRQDAKAIYK